MEEQNQANEMNKAAEASETNENIVRVLIVAVLLVLVVGFILWNANADEKIPPPTPMETEEQEQTLTEEARRNLAGVAHYFDVPNIVQEGESALFIWKADVSPSAVCTGRTEPESSEGGWGGEKPHQGEQVVGPINKNSIYFLECVDGDSQKRDVEIVSVVQKPLPEDS